MDVIINDAFMHPLAFKCKEVQGGASPFRYESVRGDFGVMAEMQMRGFFEEWFKSVFARGASALR